MRKTMRILLVMIMLCALLCGTDTNAAVIEQFSSGESIAIQPMYVDTRTTDVSLIKSIM